MKRITLKLCLGFLLTCSCAYSFADTANKSDFIQPPITIDDYEPAALEKLRVAAENGNAQTQANFGLLYAIGQGVSRDNSKAEPWFRKAAERGLVSAQYNLGIMLGNHAQAAQWFRKAAEQGNAPAQYRLGLCYDYGRGGVEKDKVQEVLWYRKAAEQGHVDAQYNLGVLYLNSSGVPQDDALAAQWFLKAAENGNSNAQSSAIFRYVTGYGVPKDYAQAVQWYRNAAEQEDSVTLVALKEMLSFYDLVRH